MCWWVYYWENRNKTHYFMITFEQLTIDFNENQDKAKSSSRSIIWVTKYLFLISILQNTSNFHTKAAEMVRKVYETWCKVLKYLESTVLFDWNKQFTASSLHFISKVEISPFHINFCIFLRSWLLIVPDLTKDILFCGFCSIFLEFRATRSKFTRENN